MDLRLKGEASSRLEQLDKPKAGTVYGIRPHDFTGIVPRMRVHEGDTVLAGSTLFVDKDTEKIAVVSPVSGKVIAVERGERRKILNVKIEADGQQQMALHDVKDVTSAEALIDLMAASGLFAFVRQRPYDVIASPLDHPKAIYVSAFSKMPLAASFDVAVAGGEQDFKSGLAALHKIAPVFLGISPEQERKTYVPDDDTAQVTVFEGLNPAGNVGVQINHVDPVNKGEVVWTLDPEMVIALGRLLRTGSFEQVRCIALAGSLIKDPHYLKVLIGSPIGLLVNGQLKESDAHHRLINGNPLVGEHASVNDYLGAFAHELCAIPEGDDVVEPFGWIAPRLRQFSVSHSYFSWLQPHSRKYDLDCRIKGGERRMIMSGEYDRVFPMDIFPSYLVKAIITEDIDKQEELGIYEVAPEDFACAEFVDSSKLPLQQIVREGLDKLRKENA